MSKGVIWASEYSLGLKFGVQGGLGPQGPPWICYCMGFLAHLAYMQMSLCNHDLSVMCHCHPSLVSAALLSSLLVLSSVYSCPSDSIAHRHFISCRYMYIWSLYMHMKYWISVIYTFEMAAILAKFLMWLSYLHS